jgi:hypothetical protein
MFMVERQETLGFKLILSFEMPFENYSHSREAAERG